MDIARHGTRARRVGDSAYPRPMREVLMVAVGGGVGSALRWLVSAPINERWPAAGTAVVNVVGSLAIGVLAGFLAARDPRSPAWLALGTGVLGGFTTFSAWTLEAIGVIDRPARLATTILIPLGAGLVAVWIGLRVGRAL